ncbi:very long chain fatty acid elongase 7-like [Polyergus mexicanus]|uniref:very long chain fatty acid elongase 7-like n=1 Tax=Polyergus mexicanus TaxID=615972 RepID=UPI0038B435D7
MDFLQEAQRRWTKQLDPRVADFPLIQSSYHVPLIIFAYLYFILGCGPRFMKNRRPYSMKTFIKLYNIFQIVANAWLIYESIDIGLFTNLNIMCPIVFDFSYDYIPMRVCTLVWYYFLLKLLDYVETAIFVLRKKNNQVSALHLYHHITTLLFAWCGTRFYAVGPGLFYCVLNNFIHVIMYTYYFLAAYGPNVQKAIAPMKQWLTIAQMVQFVIIIIYSLQNFLPGCKKMEHWLAILFIGNIMINFYLFYNFYQKAYNKRRVASHDKEP